MHNCFKIIGYVMLCACYAIIASCTNLPIDNNVYYYQDFKLPYRVIPESNADDIINISWFKDNKLLSINLKNKGKRSSSLVRIDNNKFTYVLKYDDSYIYGIRLKDNYFCLFNIVSKKDSILSFTAEYAINIKEGSCKIENINSEKGNGNIAYLSEWDISLYYNVIGSSVDEFFGAYLFDDNGFKKNIDIGSFDVLSPQYISFLDKYLLRHEDYKRFNSGQGPRSYKLLDKNGNVSEFPYPKEFSERVLNGNGFDDIWPYKEGYVISRWAGPKRGIYLLFNNKVRRVFNGEAFLVRVSPNGCAIAFASRTPVPLIPGIAQYLKHRSRSVYIMNICQGE